MTYDNCEKYIKEIALKEIKTHNLYRKKIIVDGFDVLSKAFIYFFLKEGIYDIEIFDDRKIGEKWCGLEIQSEDQIYDHIYDFTKLYILITPLRDCQRRVDSLKKNNPDFENSIHVFNNITMNTLPNNLVIPKGAKEITLREAQLKQLKILRWFHRFCEEHGLRYYIDFGTLIGAVRHKGFIPWDDDIDVSMPASDFMRLGELLPSESDFKWNSLFNKSIIDMPISTLSKIESKEFVTEYRYFPVRAWSGKGIDIFPICGFPKDEKEQIAFRNEFLYWESVWSEKVVLQYGTNNYSKTTHRKLFDKMNEILTRYDYDTSENIGMGYFGKFIPTPMDGTMIMPKEWYKQYIMMEFEGEMYRCPVGYDNSLRKWYGDYMQLPPVEEQIPHGSYKIYGYN